jgi:hypothetical protein
MPNSLFVTLIKSDNKFITYPAKGWIELFEIGVDGSVSVGVWRGLLQNGTISAPVEIRDVEFHYSTMTLHGRINGVRSMSQIRPFTWGQVIDIFDYDFDGKKFKVVKYHPWKERKGSSTLGNTPDFPDLDVIYFHNDELHQSEPNLDSLLLAWIARKNMGLNQHTLVAGIARALCVGETAEE